MNWRVIVAVVVALFIGAGAGALAEHQRLKNKSNKSASSSTKHPTTTTTVAVDFFGANKPAACAPLKQFQSEVALAAIQSRTSSSAWPVARAELAKQSALLTNTYRALLAHAIGTGKIELQYLIANATALRSALTKAASAQAYAASTKSLGTARATTDVRVLLTVAASCPKS